VLFGLGWGGDLDRANHIGKSHPLLVHPHVDLDQLLGDFFEAERILGEPGGELIAQIGGCSVLFEGLQVATGLLGRSLQLGLLETGDRLPTAQQVVASLAINPNTVLKAYKELETKGLTAGRPGQGTFIQATLGQVALPELAGLHKSLLGWLTTADTAGLDEDGIVALFASALRDFYKRRSGTGERRGARSGEAEGVA